MVVVVGGGGGVGYCKVIMGEGRLPWCVCGTLAGKYTSWEISAEDVLAK